MRSRVCDDFFSVMRAQRLALTFDDVRLRTDHSSSDLKNFDLGSRFSRNVALKVPIVSAAMDRVTEKEMAIALASLGGLGIIHRGRGFDPETQSKQVRSVKLRLNGLITKPVCVRDADTIGEVRAMCQQNNFDFRSFPVVDEDGRLVGVLTGNDIDFSSSPDQTVSQVMTKDVIARPDGTDRAQAYEAMRQQRIKVLPLVTDDRQVAGLYVWSDLQRNLDQDASHNVDANGQLRVGAAIGTSDADFERGKLLIQRGADVIVIDSAHGDSDPVIKMLERLKQEAPGTDIVAGNISEFAAALRLIEAGADGIKVGQGGGSICTTRVVCGIGTPQLTAIYNCARAVRDCESDVPVCGDGGLRASGDMVIALAGGADSVMVGMMLAGTDESPGEVRIVRGSPVKSYRGMGSISAMEESSGSRDRYGEGQVLKDLMVAEGVDAYVPYIGSVAGVIHKNVEGIRRGLGYVGVTNIAELHEKGDFIRITSAGLFESRPHDVQVSDN